MKDLISKIIKKGIKTEKDLMVVKRKMAKKSGRKIVRNSEIYKEYRELLEKKKIKRSEVLEALLKKRAVRTMSGIAPVAVLTKPYSCPGKCAYCPREKNVPTSYLSNEPAVMRAIRNKYNPYDQVYMRLLALEANGHQPEKIELIVIGGTWSVLPRTYKYWFIKECFRAANDFRKKDKKEKIKERKNFFDLKKELLKEQKKNEKAKYKIIGITLETRPDYINEKELIEMRELGATRVELGVQAICDKILAKNRRGHSVAETARATALLRNFGFKITYHLMPGLPGATAKKDLAMFKQLFCDERFQPDQIKFYPTVVVKGSLLYHWWRAGKYKPYSDKALENLIIECKKIIPSYVRIIRLIRDIPGESIEAGNMITNLRQVMKQKGVMCNCIRCRECREKKVNEKDLKLNILKYPTAGGEEYFLSFDSRDGRTLYGFCRLRLPRAVIARSEATKQSCRAVIARSEATKQSRLFSKQQDYFVASSEILYDNKFSFLNESALVRELHVYGELVPVRFSPLNKGGVRGVVQHMGLGKRLLHEAEKIARDRGFAKIAVIAGIGVRGYYKKEGYVLKNSYMVKKLKR